ncbi:MAG: hypothetical protein QME46_09085 [Thermoanaerobacteraceae bacterium]|nr:hypothetical protein [Thermoanaerobacteraceae bacterium]
MKLTGRERNLLIFAVVFCTLLIYGNYVLIPQYGKIQKLQSDIARKEDTLEKLLSNSSDVKQKIAKAQSEISDMLEVIPYTRDTESLLKSLDSMITTSGMQQQSIQFNEESKSAEANGNNGGNDTQSQQPQYSIVPVSMDIKGSYIQAVNLLTLLEDSKRLFNYKNISMSVDENGGIDMNLSLEYYSMGRDMEVDSEKIKGSGKENPFEPLVKPEAAQQSAVPGEIPQNIDDMLNQEFQKLFESMFQGIIKETSQANPQNPESQNTQQPQDSENQGVQAQLDMQNNQGQ